MKGQREPIRTLKSEALCEEAASSRFPGGGEGGGEPVRRERGQPVTCRLSILYGANLRQLQGDAARAPCVRSNWRRIWALTLEAASEDGDQHVRRSGNNLAASGHPEARRQ